MFTTRRRCICNTIYVTYAPVQEVQPWILYSSARKPCPRKLHFALISKTPFHLDSLRLLNLRKASKAQESQVCVSSLEKAAWMKGNVFVYGYVRVVLESCTIKHLTFNETLTQALAKNTALRGYSAQPGANHLAFYRLKDFVDFASNVTSGLFFLKKQVLAVLLVMIANLNS